MEEIITPTSRSQALSLGAVRYFTGKKCRRGHIAERRTNGGKCVECARQQQALWRKENPEEARESRRKRGVIYYAANKEKWTNYNAKYRSENKELIRDRQSLYRAQNPEIRRSQRHARRARERNAEGHWRASDIDRIRRAQRNKCACCKVALTKSGEHIDHIIPLSKGGTNWPKNIQLLCPPCNLSKSDKSPLEWSREIGRLI